MKDKQINIIGQLIYLSISIVLILSGFKIIAIIIAQAISVVVMRILLYRTFFTKEVSEKLKNAVSKPQQEILQAVYPNAVKIGLTSLGGILVTRSSLIIGSLFLTLDQIASYGITMQLITVISALGSIYLATFQPRIVHLRVNNHTSEIRKIYDRARILLLVTYVVGGLGLIFVGPWILKLIGSKTLLMPVTLTALAVLGSLIETNVSMSGTILLTKNYVPFFKASLISGGLIALGNYFGLRFFDFGLMTIIAVPIIITICYQGWKWPLEAQLDLMKMKEKSYEA